MSFSTNLPLRPANCLLDKVEVFRTTIDSAGVAADVLRELHEGFPTLQATLDLDDCDRILRIESREAGPELWAQVMVRVQGMGIEISILPE